MKFGMRRRPASDNALFSRVAAQPYGLLRDNLTDACMLLVLVVCAALLIFTLKMLLVHILCGLLFMMVAAFTLVKGQEARLTRTARVVRVHGRGVLPRLLGAAGRLPRAQGEGVDGLRRRQPSTSMARSSTCRMAKGPRTAAAASCARSCDQRYASCFFLYVFWGAARSAALRAFSFYL